MSMVRTRFDKLHKASALIKAAGALGTHSRGKKMTLREAALNVKFMNMLLNRTFLRSRIEQQQMQRALRAGFACFEGVGDMFLQELLAAADVVSLKPGDVVTVQGERVQRFFVVISGSIGTLNHAAVENWHKESRGPLADVSSLPPPLQELVLQNVDVPAALLDLDAHPMQYNKYVSKPVVMQVLAAVIAEQHDEESDGAPPPVSHGPSIVWMTRDNEVALHDSTRWSKGTMTLDAGCAIGSEMLKNATDIGGGRLKWPFTCVATSASEIMTFNIVDLERAAKNRDKHINAEMDTIMLAITKAPSISAAAATSPKLSLELRACAERSHVVWIGRNSKVISQGEPLDAVYMLLDGTLSVYVAQKAIISTIPPPPAVPGAEKAFSQGVSWEKMAMLAPGSMFGFAAFCTNGGLSAATFVVDGSSATLLKLPPPLPMIPGKDATSELADFALSIACQESAEVSTFLSRARSRRPTSTSLTSSSFKCPVISHGSNPPPPLSHPVRSTEVSSLQQLLHITASYNILQALAAIEAFSSYYAAANTASSTEKTLSESPTAIGKGRGSPRHLSVAIAPLPRSPQQARLHGFADTSTSSSPRSPPSPSHSNMPTLLFSHSYSVDSPKTVRPVSVHTFSQAFEDSNTEVSYREELSVELPKVETGHCSQTAGPSLLIHRREWDSRDSSKHSLSAAAKAAELLQSRSSPQTRPQTSPSLSSAYSASNSRVSPTFAGDLCISLNEFARALPHVTQPPQPALRSIPWPTSETIESKRLYKSVADFRIKNGDTRGSFEKGIVEEQHQHGDEEMFAVSPTMRVKKPFEEVMYFAGMDKGRVSCLKVKDDEFLNWDEIGSRPVVMVNEQADVHAAGSYLRHYLQLRDFDALAANSTVCRKMSTSPPRNRPVTPEQLQQKYYLSSPTRNNKITMMNLRSPLDASDWGREDPQINYINVSSDIQSTSCADVSSLEAAIPAVELNLLRDQFAQRTINCPDSADLIQPQSERPASASETLHADESAALSPTAKSSFGRHTPLGSMRALTITLPSSIESGNVVVSGSNNLSLRRSSPSRNHQRLPETGHWQESWDAHYQPASDESGSPTVQMRQSPPPQLHKGLALSSPGGKVGNIKSNNSSKKSIAAYDVGLRVERHKALDNRQVPGIAENSLPRPSTAPQLDHEHISAYIKMPPQRSLAADTKASPPSLPPMRFNFPTLPAASTLSATVKREGSPPRIQLGGLVMLGKAYKQ